VNNEPLVSVLIPTYNRAEYLDDCLYSTLVQDYKNCEVYIRDNDSSDNTKEIVEKYRPLFKDFTYYRYKRNDTNVGFRDNMIHGTKECRGKYSIILMDDDFLCSRTAVSSMVQALEATKKTSLTVSQSETYRQGEMDLSAKEIINHGKEIVSHSEFKTISGEYYFLNSWTVYGPICLSSVMFDTKKLLASPWEKWTHNSAIDVNLYHAISPGNNIAIIEDPLTYYRLHETQDIHVFPVEDAMSSHSRIMLWYKYAKEKRVASSTSLFIWRLKTVILKDSGPIKWLSNRKPPILNKFISWLRGYNLLHYFVLRYLNPQMIKYDYAVAIKCPNLFIRIFKKTMLHLRRITSRLILRIDRALHNPDEK